MGATSFARKQALQAAVPKVVTGILMSYTGSLGTVNVLGQTLTLPMLDSVSSTIAVGSTVLCHVHGNSGFIIGSVNTVSRAGSGAWTGSFSNPPVPRPVQGGISYTNVSPNQVGLYDDAVGSFATTGTTFTQTDRYGGAWFYGSGAFTSLTGKTLLSLEVYLPGLSSGAYPLNLSYHLYATRPASGGLGLGAVTRSTSGWVALPSAFLTALSGSLSAFGVGVAPLLGTSLTLNNALPYGTLRIGWSN